jgi:tight adherence protein C
MILLLLLGVVLTAVCVGLLGRAIALPRLRAIGRLGQIDAYGFSASADGAPAAPRAVAGAVDQLAKGLGAFFSGRMKGLSESDSKRELMAAGMYRTTPATLVGYRVISAVSLLITGLWLAASSGLSGPLVPFTVVVLPLMGWLAPVTIVRRRARTRLEHIDRELPELVDLLVVSVESGLGLSSAMKLAAERVQGPLGDEMRLAMQEQTMGLPTDQVLANILTRSDTPAMRSFVRSVRQGESLGVSIGQILRNLALEMRKRRRGAAEERAQKAPIKILFPLALLIFPALFIVLLAPAMFKLVDAIGGGS